jgi:hypothetical protein
MCLNYITHCKLLLSLISFYSFSLKSLQILFLFLTALYCQVTQELIFLRLHPKRKRSLKCLWEYWVWIVQGLILINRNLFFNILFFITLLILKNKEKIQFIKIKDQILILNLFLNQNLVRIFLHPQK